MANKNEIRIESILGGISDYENFGGADQFSFSSGIDPDNLALLDHSLSSNNPTKSSGYLNPVVFYSHATTSAFPMWLVTTPKNNEIYIYDAGGAIYSTTVVNEWATTITTLSSSVGGGSAYYDNYVYFSTNSTVARFGPLNQDSPAINADYWGNSLGKTSLSATVYPTFVVETPLTPGSSYYYPNHIMHRHSNGKLYFTDVVGNQGVLHCISTKKTTVEGDTDDGSTYNAIDFPPGMWPTAMANYGSDLAVALYEGNTTQNTQQRAKVAFWDTTNPDNYYQITSTEFPDTFISAMINSNGVLYVFSGPNPKKYYDDIQAEENNIRSLYTRVSRFVGGYTFEQIAFIQNCLPPTQAGADAMLNKILFAGLLPAVTFYTPSTYGNAGGGGTIFSIGSNLSGISKVLNSITPAYEVSDEITAISAVKLVSDGYINEGLFFTPKVSFNGIYYICKTSSNGSPIGNPSWKSQIYRIGKPFKITKITLNTTNGDAQMIYVNIFCDDSKTHYTQTTFGKGSQANDSHIPVRFENATGTNNFYILLTWDPSSAEISSYTPSSITLPIIIEYELLDNY